MVSSRLIKMLHPHRASYMAYYIQTDDKSTVFVFFLTSLWAGRVSDGQTAVIAAGHARLILPSSKREHARSRWMDSLSTCRRWEHQRRTDSRRCVTKDGADHAVIRYSSCIAADTMSQWLTVNMCVWGKQRLNVKPAWAKTVHYRLKCSAAHVLIVYHYKCVNTLCHLKWYILFFLWCYMLNFWSCVFVSSWNSTLRVVLNVWNLISTTVDNGQLRTACAFKCRR